MDRAGIFPADLKRKHARLGFLDSIRGLTLISMIVYHAMWDLVNLYGVNVEWYELFPGLIWQQSICMTFILLSGFCSSLGSHPIKRGLAVFGCGAIVTAVTLIVLSEGSIIFGILTFLGSAMILTGIAKPVLDRITGKGLIVGATVSILLFVIFYRTGCGYLGIGELVVMDLPQVLYQNYLTSFLGFPFEGFVSSDYFALIPWIFLFLTGYFLGRIGKEFGFHSIIWKKEIQILSFLGRNSLLFYMIHQVVIYFVLLLLHSFGFI